jgi:phenylacetate-CoA ligase
MINETQSGQSRDERLRLLVQHAYTHAPAVQRRFDDAGIKPEAIQTVNDLLRLPIMSKDDVIALQQADPPFGGLLGLPLSEIRHIFFSPGPLYEPDSSHDPTVLAMAIRCLEISGFTAADMVLNTLSYHLVPAGLLVDLTLAKMGCTVVPGGVGNTDLQVKLLQDLAITGYVGTPSFLLALIHRAEKLGFDFRRDFQLRKAAVTAEPLPPDLRHTLTETYGLTVSNIYGTAELGLLAVSTGGMAMQLMAEPIIEIVTPDDGRPVGSGEVGEVVATNFNPAYPLIRYGTGDLAVNVDPNPGQSRQEERAIILVGRSGEAVKVRGMFVHPNQLRFAAAQLPGVEQLQALVTRPGDTDFFTLRVRLADGVAGDGLVEPVKEAVQAVCRVRVNEIEFVAAEDLPLNAPGIVDERQFFEKPDYQ